jgi:hypothetical protein
MSNTISLSVLAAEHGFTVDQLARRLGDQVSVHNGIRVVPTEVAIAMHDQRERRQRRQREQTAARREEMAEHSASTRERVRAIKREQDGLRAAGLLAPDTPALAVVAGAEKASALARGGRVFDELMAANRRGDAGSYTPIRGDD